ncbi:hypothetical protein CNYM01_09373 [Colletotrichum nymphaeae SA-01]|uniref:Uncharacterized protein n=1 Tax=Colletotrichum nymphaeae SA-01 TaxID=1460502 RepID=A0A135UKA5_9PEZI|nr:hypothetical protein CNYM01_09373 [Colletotrichum nymphaeae SA-01]
MQGFRYRDWLYRGSLVKAAMSPIRRSSIPRQEGIEKDLRCSDSRDGLLSYLREQSRWRAKSRNYEKNDDTDSTIKPSTHPTYPSNSPSISIIFSPHHNTLHCKPSSQSSQSTRLTSPNPTILKMKSFTVMAIALLGLANAATIRICKDQTLGNCVTMDVGGCSTFPRTLRIPSDLLSLHASFLSALSKREAKNVILANFPGNMNDVVSSVDTGSATCTFFTDGSCGGASWTTRGLQNTVPSNFNDNLSSVRC